MWRYIVRGTRGNPVAMSAFSLTTMIIIPIGLGTVIMSYTNPELDEAKLAQLRRGANLDSTVVQDVNKRRLGVLFDELQRGEKGEDRWKEALDGRTKGTTTGSSQGIKM